MEGSEHDRLLPIANISRIMKKALPPHAKLSLEAKQAVQHCVSEFISFITSEACETCTNEKRKTLNCDDLLCALNTLGFGKYIDMLQIYRQKSRNAKKGDEQEHKVKERTDSEHYNEDYFLSNV